MLQETTIKTKDTLTGKNYVYEYRVKTDSADIFLCSNTTSDCSTDKTHIMITTLNGDSILIDQHQQTISINGTKIQLKGDK